MYRKNICIVSGTALLKFILFKNFRTHERNFVSHSPHLFYYSFGKKKTTRVNKPITLSKLQDHGQDLKDGTFCRTQIPFLSKFSKKGFQRSKLGVYIELCRNGLRVCLPCLPTAIAGSNLYNVTFQTTAVRQCA